MNSTEARKLRTGYLLEELSDAERKAVAACLETDSDLRLEFEGAERRLFPMRRLTAPEVGIAALNSLLEKARAEIESGRAAPVFSLRDFVRGIGGRVAAAAVVAVLLGAAMTSFGRPDSHLIGRVTDAMASSRIVRANEVVEARIGTQLRVTFLGGEVLLDGPAAVRLTHGDGALPRLEILRGRVVASATDRGSLHVVAGAERIEVMADSTAAIDFDTPYEHVTGAGALVQIQRIEISRVARIGEETYGLRIDISRLPAEAKGRRISIFGSHLSATEFVESFQGATDKLGLKFERDGRRVSLTYTGEGVADNGDSLHASVVQVAAVHGRVVCRRGALGPLQLESSGSNVVELLPGAEFRAQRSNARVMHMVVWVPKWAGNEPVTDYVGNLVASEASLPHGTVILRDRLVLRDAGSGGKRVLIMNGEYADIPLLNGKRARLVGLMSSGAEFEYEGGERVRVPFR